MNLERMVRESAQRCWCGCGKVVIRAQTWKLDEVKKRGERPGTMPLDPGERPRDDTYANIAVSAGPAGTVLARVLRRGEEPLPDEVRYVTHFATCTHYNGQAPLPDGVTRHPDAATRPPKQPSTKSSPPTVGGNVLVMDEFLQRRRRRGVRR